ncbi:DUF2795 domain-containing protein [Allocatelliglobosispora scoriae]|uniref:DUF2795 domain-containing protein n=1 Tax=Allocatelliglobosispora scoriae TaxID=643052 RepID=UPI00160D3DBD|nr:DUF2795 domain-containing protein [Allocatelliglobosispora scoriae]
MQPGFGSSLPAKHADSAGGDIRAHLGTYVYGAVFPTTSQDLIKAATDHQADDDVVSILRQLDPVTGFCTPAEVWRALELGTDNRF